VLENTPREEEKTPGTARRQKPKRKKRIALPEQRQVAGPGGQNPPQPGDGNRDVPKDPKSEGGESCVRDLGTTMGKKMPGPGIHKLKKVNGSSFSCIE